MVHPSHPSIVSCLFGIGLRWQQAKKVVPDIPLPSTTFHLLLSDPRAFLGQIYDPSSMFCVSPTHLVSKKMKCKAGFAFRHDNFSVSPIRVSSPAPLTSQTWDSLGMRSWHVMDEHGFNRCLIERMLFSCKL